MRFEDLVNQAQEKFTQLSRVDAAAQALGAVVLIVACARRLKKEEMEVRAYQIIEDLLKGIPEEEFSESSPLEH